MILHSGEAFIATKLTNIGNHLKGLHPNSAWCQGHIFSILSEF